uniref:hypothetical protein n=1 Tax=Escherichia coli TaxID=562 RepID=UPI00234CA454
MDMWLRQSNDAFRCPILPTSFEISGSINTSTTNVLKRGEVIVCGGTVLSATEIDIFFARRQYHF